MSQKAVFDDANIPVLTEVVQDKAVAPAAAPAPEAEPAPAAAEAEEISAGALPEQDWSALERRIAERALQQLQEPVDRVLDQALAGIADQIRAGLQQAIGAAVAQAVAQELAHLKS